eukprot:TRINITY_DN110823_c0_g1_i1.p1 TRINITY_DN110823_c0_g1~~TRINITY_DN110823_c0_g1_i1.p1  ORF type:complete len:347 (+),score=93.12 TRINITY_DN110823_c0_g1_i1:61-1101(+)
MASGGLQEPLLAKGPSAKAADASRQRRNTIIAFTCFVAVRSFHPIVIDISKTDGKLLYGKSTPLVMNSAVDVIIGNSIAFLLGGVDGLKQCWAPEPLKIFGAIAVAYAFGDFLEMQSMSVMGGSAYQILLQSKLMITALMVWFLRGQRQTLLQWNVLITIALAMSAFVLVDSGSSGGGFNPMGLLFVFLKVFFSCYCAVLAEKYLKAYKNMPIYAQVAQLKFTWFWASLALTYIFDKGVVSEGFFSGYDMRTVVVVCSWVCKGWTTFLVLKGLDSVLKNIGEAVAILCIYAFDVAIADSVSHLLPVSGKSFSLPVFMMVLVVILTVVTYTLAPMWKAPEKEKTSPV